MQQQHQQQQFQQFQHSQQQQQQPQLNNQYNPAMMGSSNHYPAQSNPMAAYNNVAPMQMSAGISPTPSVRNQHAMQASPAVAATAPQHFGPSVCHLPQAQIGQPQGQQQQQQVAPMYNNCPAPPTAVVGNVALTQQGQQSNMVGCNMQQTYSQQTGYATQTAAVNPMSNTMGYNNFNNAASGHMPCNNQTAMAMNNNNGYAMNQQCGHMVAQQQGNPAQGFNNPCSPCNGHHHHQQQQPVCNNSPAPNNNWQCGYPGTNNMQQQQQQQMPFQQNAQWNNQMQGAGTGPSNQGPMNVVNSQAMMYNMQSQPMQPMQANVAMANNYNSYTPRPPPYNQVASAIQCQDVSQSQDFINRVREAGQTNQTTSATNQQVPSGVAPVPGATATTPTPSNMRPETYQRTLEYVQQCQTWATGDNNNGRVAKENKPPQQAGCEPMTKTAETAAIGRAMLSPGQDAVSSSTDRQEAAAAAAAALLPSSGSANQSNMVVHDMNTSLNSLMQENRFLQMIQ